MRVVVTTSCLAQCAIAQHKFNNCFDPSQHLQIHNSFSLGRRSEMGLSGCVNSQSYRIVFRFGDIAGYGPALMVSQPWDGTRAVRRQEQGT